MERVCSKQMADISKQVEIELVAEAQSNPLAFRCLYERYAGVIYRYLYSKVGNKADAEDLTSQVFLEALEKLVKFRNQGGFRSWLFAIARSRAMDHYRKARKEFPLEKINLASDKPDPLTTTIRQGEIERMREEIKTLSNDEQELIRLRYIAGLSYAEIGQVLRRKEGTVKKTLYRLLARLGERMEDQHE